MCRILIFGGTSEGRLLAEFCTANHIHAFISVATEYGSELLEKSDFLNVLTGRMNLAEIREFIESNNIETVIDATHPYAVEITENIKNACDLLSVKYIRIIREQGKNITDAKYFDDIPSLVSYLNTTGGNILLTTGSKNLKDFCNINNYGKRCIIRVLPSPDIVRQCIETGFDKCRIIAEKGPFTAVQNEMHIKKFSADFLVTKDSGNTGGFMDKIRAAQKCGTEILILKRPEEKGISLDNMKKILVEEYGKTS